MNEVKKEMNNFIQKIINDDSDSGKWNNRVHTRFPPEPNGYLHIGHAKSICLNFGIAEKNKGTCNLRFDDTNPVKEEEEYVQSIIEDVKWLGFDWEDRLFYASDYFEQLYEFAIQLIQDGSAYICDLSGDEIRNMRGSLNEPGLESPHRTRSVEENLELFHKMKNGEFGNGEKVLRAKINMAHPNLNMRDPVMYRILHAKHHRTGNDWCIYPMYDWAHGLEDSIERITHSICTLEFEDHRPLYDWYLNQLDIYHPQQIEFARLNLNFTMMSKRKLKQLVDENHVSGWDDPRMPTISGLRRRGYTPKAIRNFAEDVGVTKRDSIIDVVRLENALREDLNKIAPRVMGVLDPLKVVITNYPEDKTELLKAVNNPENPDAGKRDIPFSKELYIEQSDFMEDPPRKFFRLGPGREVRLRYAYFITCNEVIKNKSGEIIELHCTYDSETKGGSAPDGRKVKGTLHWVSVNDAIDAEVRLYDRLFLNENPGETDDFLANLNPESCKTQANAKLESSLSNPENITYQFERNGYFIKDEKDSMNGKLVFNRAVSLRDSWAKFFKNNGK
ncbi:MAG: glutamine--tRNA ligase/YqeY domain fusion protein [Candidatus Marinimicrobia bacterium]|jgi:glutaminyl-tRNA synthetase|nr:glutamine--tRNA ligase/YqeY domain fusion protein [Candidatus Neomarinimicrobiota bacterium]MBT3502019.1 glutamine--tRNA ligase/YqeY domain fusion protein [Candidatus Neomarinimicrobiota bacterium]MBT3838487.1 glutamine--tRNA ligase/YqeY domain fusion protein [Candidatus Neomarinimicrobiota bacterium]MBT3999516.1 glutamine--tRNA ligase/YqeY domain fusion protein [Candidatus Neomarinimicrobiota bacterium]MBT4281788.1 glutamine--tRNA ligase/YqeY domain fusion protein [Candidatus Neomarinimicro